MRKKGGNFFEEHIEKIMLVIVGLVCMWLLITRVVISPNKVLYAGEKLSPGKIDIRISDEADFLKLKLDSKPEPLPPYIQRVDAFVDTINLPIGDIDVNLYWPLPIHSSTDVSDKRKYSIPWIGEVEDAAVSYIRAVAYVPTVEIDEENHYDMTLSMPNDIDFVTVEAKFDVAGLHGRFYDSFAGDGVEQEEWRDPCLADPVFAAVQLQRQELGADGSWSEWQTVPRTKIDLRKKMFESVEEVGELPPGGIKVRLLQFDDAEVRMALLHPEAYKIASAKEEWFPPSLHKKYVEQQEEMEAEKKRRDREAERLGREQEREEAREERRGRTSETGSSQGQNSGRRGDSTRREDRLGTGGVGRETRSRRDRGDRRGETESLSRREELEEREREREARLAELRATSITTTLDDIYKELDKILITERTNLTKIREPLLFWAHDDTAEPGKSYRYRIRLGVFNPIAGTNKFNEQDEGLKNQIVLWSEFSEVKEIVKVPGTLYFFPRDVQDAARIVTVHVARYKLGHWYIKDFAVKPGEDIGKVAEFEPVEEKTRPLMMPSVPEIIDYTTGAVLVDVVPVNDWSGGRNMYARHYYDMLYSLDGVGIEHIPVSMRYWDEELRIKLNEITKSQKEPKEPLRAWDSKLASWELAPELEYRYDDSSDSSADRRRTTRRSR
ncbi:MAG: hypothetical protein WBC22_19130 [Sedimentisphaerales bacterium]